MRDDWGSVRTRTTLALVGVLAGLLAVGALWMATPQPSSASEIGAAASAGYTGGILTEDAPPYMLNDGTVYGLRWGASGLETSTAYYVKVRISPVPDGRGQERNRGFTWNPVSGQWVHERDNWLLMPRMTTDGSGNLSGDEWLFTKFSDEATSGTYYLVVSLSKTGLSSTLNPSISSTVTVINAKTAGGWVHNASTTGVSAGKRIDATMGPTVYALSKAETNTVDDDGNGTTDDENWCYLNASRLKSFRLGVPISTLFTVRSQRNPLAWATDQQVLVADTDIALGAADITPPTAASGLTATAAWDGSVALDWDAGTDDKGVYGYYVYRWNDPLPVDGLLGVYTPDHVKVGQVTGGATAFVDTSAPRGKTAYYEVRSVDTSSNLSPRSGTASALVARTPVPQDVFRFYNKRMGTHFYTANVAERDQVMATLGWLYDYEGPAYALNTASYGNDVPLFRFYNKLTGTHFYTADATERDRVIATLGWVYQYEGVAYLVSLDTAGTTPVFRFYNKRAGTHFYTADPAERDRVIATLGWVYEYEGVAYYLAP